MLLKSRVFPLSLPLIAEQGLITSIGVVNAAMATNLGRDAASAIGVVDSISVMVISFAQAMALGGTVVVAQHTGRRDRAAADHAATQAVFSGTILGLFLGLALAVFRRPAIEILFGGLEPGVRSLAETYLGIIALGYPFLILSLVASGVLRGAGDARLPMLINIGINAVNVVAGRILIYGLGPFPGYGIAGAAWAVTAARALGALAFAACLVSGSGAASLPRLGRLRFDPAVLKTIFAIGIPASVEALMFNGGKLITQMYIVGLGTLALTANYITTTIAGFAQIPANAFSLAATPIVGREIGRGDRRRAKDILLATVVLSSLVLVFCCLPMFFLGGRFIGLYTKDADVIGLALGLLRGFCAAAPLLWSVSFLLPAGLRGGGDSRYVMGVSMLSMWALRVVLGYVLGIAMGFGILGVWIAMYADWALRGIFFCARFSGGKWIRASRESPRP
jgi:putative MATE family efflux protein